MSHSRSVFAAGVAVGASATLISWAVVHVRDKLKRFGRARSEQLTLAQLEVDSVPEALAAWRREAEVAVELARECGLAMQRAADDAKAVDWKGAGTLDPCTATDRDNEALVCRRLALEFPAHAVVGEEAAAATGRIPAVDPAVPTWVVDPIDGTQNFFHDLPLACVSIGLMHRGAPQLGVVYDPYRDEMYVAARGYGAFVNGRRLKPAGGAGEPAELAEALVLTDPGYERSPGGVAKLVALHGKLLAARTRAVRIVGSSVLSVLLVASGRASAFVAGVGDGGDSPKPWDWCAAAVFARETGCVLEPLDDRVHAPATPKPRRPGDDFDVFAMSGVCSRSRALADAIIKIARP